MTEQTKQKIIETAKKWIDDIFGVSRKLYTNKKLRESAYFVDELRYFIGRLAFDSGEDFTIADEQKIIDIVLA